MGTMNDSILLTIKKMLGLDEEYTPFDTDVTVHLNSALMELYQLGVGTKGFQVYGYETPWSELVTDETMLGAVQNYLYLSVRRLFDPPSNSFVMDAIQKQIEKLGWQLNVQAESVKTFDFITDDEHARKRGWPGNDVIEGESAEESDP